MLNEGIMPKYLIANWKMNLLAGSSLELAEKYKQKLKGIKGLELAVAPSALYLDQLGKFFRKTNIKLVAQNVAAQDQGAWTGEVSAKMLKEIGCGYVIVGHSERRHKMGETNEMVNKKINQCFNNGLTPILCIGETEDEKEAGRRNSVLVKQLQTALDKVNGLPENKLLIAYEPVWAIGTGLNMSAAAMFEVERLVKRTLSGLYSEKFYDTEVSLIYGGSVSSINAQEFWNLDFMQGMLVGTASLDAVEFELIAQQAS